MNNFLKIASGAALSAIALSVAALAVPSIKVHALKLIDELLVVQTPVKNVMLGEGGGLSARVMDEAILVGVSDLDLVKLPTASGENANGVFGTSGGVFGGGMSNNQNATRGGVGLIGWGGISPSNGLVTGGAPRGRGQMAGGSGAKPTGSGAPGVEAVASDDGVPSPVSLVETPDGGADIEPLLISAAPHGPGTDESELVDPEIDIFEDIAAIPIQPGNGLGNDPDSVVDVAQIAQPMALIALIPEPGTLALLGFALLGVGAIRRQRFNR